MALGLSNAKPVKRQEKVINQVDDKQSKSSKKLKLEVSRKKVKESVSPVELVHVFIPGAFLVERRTIDPGYLGSLRKLSLLGLPIPPLVTGDLGNKYTEFIDNVISKVPLQVSDNLPTVDETLTSASKKSAKSGSSEVEVTFL